MINLNRILVYFICLTILMLFLYDPIQRYFSRIFYFVGMALSFVLEFKMFFSLSVMSFSKCKFVILHSFFNFPIILISLLFLKKTNFYDWSLFFLLLNILFIYFYMILESFLYF